MKMAFFGLMHFLLLLYLSLLALPAQGAVSCGAPPPLEVSVAPVFAETEYEFRLPMRGIKKVALEGSNKAFEKGHWPTGLATGELFFNMRTQIVSRRHLHTGAVCGGLRRVELELGFINNKIYVAREFPRRSCAHKEILAHEEMHKAIDRELLDEYAAKAEEVFASALESVGAVSAPGEAGLQAALTEKANATMEGLTKEMEAERSRRQIAFDSLEEYARIANACEGQVQGIMNERAEQFSGDE